MLIRILFSDWLSVGHSYQFKEIMLCLYDDSNPYRSGDMSSNPDPGENFSL